GTDIEIRGGSTVELGPSNVTANRIRILDNSVVSIESALFGSQATSVWNSGILIDRGSVLRLNIEDSPTDVAFTQSGNVEVSLTSSLELFGANSNSVGFPNTMKLGVGTSDELFVGLRSSVVANGATIASDTITVLNGSVAFAQFARVESTPEVAVSHGGVVLDFVDQEPSTTDTNTFSGDFASCSSGGQAFDSGGNDACLPIP
ncbi:MAG: hypothetical protein AAF664_26225, partial [Planctomycetota bacterium]